MANAKGGMWVVVVAAIAVFTVMELLSSGAANETATADAIENTAEPAAALPLQSDADMVAINQAEDEDANEMDLVSEFDAVVEEVQDMMQDLQQVTEDVVEDVSNNVSEHVDQFVADGEEAISEVMDSPQEALVDESTFQPEQVAVQQTESSHSVQEHLDAAEKAIAALRLTTPEEDSAYKHYMAVLAIDSGNAEAAAGLEKIVDMYIYFYNEALAEGKPGAANVYLQRAENVMPDSPKLRNIR